MPIHLVRVLAVLVVAFAAAAAVPSIARGHATARPAPSPVTAAAAASPSASPIETVAGSPAATLPPMVGAPGTTSTGTTIRGALGILVGIVIIAIGWRRRRRPLTRR